LLIQLPVDPAYAKQILQACFPGPQIEDDGAAPLFTDSILALQKIATAY
jgi:hypothetical protein